MTVAVAVFAPLTDTATTPLDVVRLLPNASRVWIEIVVTEPTTPAGTVAVDCPPFGAATTMAIEALVPTLPPVVAVTVVDVGTTVCVVRSIVATPAAFVVELPPFENEPFGSDLVHATT